MRKFKGRKYYCNSFWKGRVGKSTVTANLAVALQRKGYKVGVVDADIYGPSQHIMFDVEKSRPQASQVNGKPVMLPVEKLWVKLVSIGFLHQALRLSFGEDLWLPKH